MAGFREHMVDIGNPAGDGILDGHHRQFRPSAFDRLKRVLDGGASHRLAAGIGGHARKMGIGPGSALVRDRIVGVRHIPDLLGLSRFGAVRACRRP